MSSLTLISTRQCARFFGCTITKVRKCLASGKIEFVRDENIVYKISLRSALEYAQYKGIEVNPYDIQKVKEKLHPWREDVNDVYGNSETNSVTEED